MFWDSLDGWYEMTYGLKACRPKPKESINHMHLTCSSSK